MNRPSITSDLAQALQRLVAADMRLREAACGGGHYQRAVTRFDAAAEKVARGAARRFRCFGGGMKNGQNTSTAVMQRRVEPADSLEDFPTPPWATRALVEHVLVPRIVSASVMRAMSVWEPTCNRGHMARPLAEYFGDVRTSDIHHYGWEGQQHVEDFLFPGTGPKQKPDWLIFNPPFRLASEFILKALDDAHEGVAAIVRTAFLEGIGRHRDLFGKIPPTIVAQFTERVVMVKGHLTATGSTATAYCWVVWADPLSRSHLPPEFVWIPPCRKKLERPGDYA